MAILAVVTETDVPRAVIALAWHVAQARREGLTQQPASAKPVARHGVDRVPHGLRAMVPGRVRRGLRKVAGRER